MGQIESAPPTGSVPIAKRHGHFVQDADREIVCGQSKEN